MTAKDFSTVSFSRRGKSAETKERGIIALTEALAAILAGTPVTACTTAKGEHRAHRAINAALCAMGCKAPKSGAASYTLTKEDVIKAAKAARTAKAPAWAADEPSGGQSHSNALAQAIAKAEKK